MVSLSLVGGRSEQEEKISQSATWKVENGHQEEEGSLLCHSKGTAVVQEVTQRECASAHGFVFQGTAGDESRDIREGAEMPG